MLPTVKVGEFFGNLFNKFNRFRLHIIPVFIYKSMEGPGIIVIAMGDMIEMTTWLCHRNVFYRMSANGLIFEAKTAASAAIGLATKPGNRCDIWVVIGRDQRTWIKKESGDGKVVRTPNILNNREYKRFWLSWRNGSVELGRNNERTPIVSYTNFMDLFYVTFSSGGGDNAERNPVYWRFELPPILEKPRMQSVTNGKLVWVRADNCLPEGALIGGYEMENLYIIRAPHQGSVTPGKFVSSEGTGYISWGGESHEKNEFEVLCGFDCAWVPTSDDRIPVGAVEGGYSEGPERETLYVGRATYSGHVISGKVQPSHRVCYIPFAGREVALKKYEILVSPDVNARCANKLFIEHIDLRHSPPSSEYGEDDLEDVYPDRDSEEEILN